MSEGKNYHHAQYVSSSSSRFTSALKPSCRLRALRLDRPDRIKDRGPAHAVLPGEVRDLDVRVFQQRPDLLDLGTVKPAKCFYLEFLIREQSLEALAALVSCGYQDKEVISGTITVQFFSALMPLFTQQQHSIIKNIVGRLDDSLMKERAHGIEKYGGMTLYIANLAIHEHFFNAILEGL